MTANRSCEFEERSIELTQYEKQRNQGKKRERERKKRNSSMYGAITKYPIFVLSESQKERKKENGGKFNLKK